MLRLLGYSVDRLICSSAADQTPRIFEKPLNLKEFYLW
jgi:hypothetical protein